MNNTWGKNWSHRRSYMYQPIKQKQPASLPLKLIHPSIHQSTDPSIHQSIYHYTLSCWILVTDLSTSEFGSVHWRCMILSWNNTETEQTARTASPLCIAEPIRCLIGGAADAGVQTSHLLVVLAAVFSPWSYRQHVADFFPKIFQLHTLNGTKVMPKGEMYLNTTK